MALLLASIAAALAYGPIPQPSAYHDYADRRAWLGVPNAADVLTNAPFLVVGLLCLLAAVRSRRETPPRPAGERTAFAAYGAGVALTAFGSVVYHLDPADATLVWDRLPMSLAFTAFFALILGERLGERVGRAALLPLLILGPASVLLWALSLEDSPGGDLRAYLLVKFLPAAGAVLLLLLVPEPRATRRPIALSLLAFGLATVLELLDRDVFRVTAGLVSGHTLKHLVAAAAASFLLWWSARRRALRAG